MQTFNTNAYAYGEEDLVLDLASRPNHSRSENVLVEYHPVSPTDITVSFRVVRVIATHEDLTSNYLPLDMANTSRSDRRELLREWGFDCCCSKCHKEADVCTHDKIRDDCDECRN
jgi:hypothetical protein